MKTVKLNLLALGALAAFVALGCESSNITVNHGSDSDEEMDSSYEQSEIPDVPDADCETWRKLNADCLASGVKSAVRCETLNGMDVVRKVEAVAFNDPSECTYGEKCVYSVIQTCAETQKCVQIAVDVQAECVDKSFDGDFEDILETDAEAADEAGIDADKDEAGDRMDDDGDGEEKCLVVEPCPINFPTIMVGQKFSKILTIKNMCGKAVTLNSAEISDSGAPFAVKDSVEWTVLHRNESAMVEVEFYPRAVGSYFASFNLSTDDGAYVCSVSGGGAFTDKPCIMFDPSTAYVNDIATLDFMEVITGTKGTKTLKFKSCGSAPLTLSSVALDAPSPCAPGANCPEFEMKNPVNEAKTLALGEEFAVETEFAPTRVGAQKHTFHINSDAQLSFKGTTDAAIYLSPNNIVVSLKGEGVAPSIVFLPEDETVDLGAAPEGCCTPFKEFKIINDGSIAAHIASIDMYVNSFYFEAEYVPHPAFPITLQPGQSYAFSLRICPLQGSVGMAMESKLKVALSEFELPLQKTVKAASVGDLATEEFVVPDNGDASMLFAVDCSGSMSPYQQKIAAAIPALVDAILKYSGFITFRIGVTSCDMDDAAHKGAFLNPAGVPGKMINVPSVNETRDSLIQKISKNLMLGTSCSGYEKCLDALAASMSEPLYSADHKNFVTSEIDRLILMVLSDEEDQSSKNIDYYVNLFKNIKIDGRRLNSYFYGIFGDCPNGCEGSDGSSAQGGCRYRQMTDELNGTTQSVCAPAYDESFKIIFDEIARLIGTFILSAKPDVSTVKVYMGGILLPNNAYTVDAEKRLLIINKPPTDSRITVKYKPVCEN